MAKEVNEKIVCAGFGGQGIMLMGKLLAQTGMKNGYHVSWLPSYGAEVRGGTAHSMVRISSDPIASPTVYNPTTCAAMNKPSFDKFIRKIEKGGNLIVNISMVDKLSGRKGIKTTALPLTLLASELGNIKVANMIAVGAFVALKKIFSLQKTLDELKNILPQNSSIFNINKKAIRLGYSLVTAEEYGNK